MRRSVPNRAGFSSAVRYPELHERPVGQEEVEQRPDRRSRGLAQIASHAQRRHDQLAYLPVHALLHLLVERLLRPEVVVQGRDADARLACDVPHRRPRQALAGERGNGRGEDALPRAIAASSDGPARASSAPAGGAHSTQRFIARTRDSATSR